jgi:hypothetical protein
MRVTELEEMGAKMDDHENGVIFYNGMMPKNKRMVNNFMSQMNLDYTLTNMFEVSKWLDEMDAENNPNNKKSTNHEANLATDDPDSRKRSRSPYTPSHGTSDEPASKKSNVYFNRDQREARDGAVSGNYRSSRDRSRSRRRDSRGRSYDN